MYVPVAVVLGGDTELGAAVAKKFYDWSNAVVLSGQNADRMDVSHKSMFRSDWIKQFRVDERSAASGRAVAEFALQEFYQVSWLASIVEYDFATADNPQPNDRERFQSQLLGPIQEAIAVSELASHQGSLTVGIQSKGGDGEACSALREWLSKELKQQRQNTRDKGIDLHFLLWTEICPDDSIEQRAWLTAKMSASIGSTLIL